MIYKATFKDYLITGLLCGMIYGLSMYLIDRNAFKAVFGFVTFSFIFPLFLALSGKHAENWVKEIRRILQQSHIITCEGSAKLNGRLGWMFLCEDALVYYFNYTPQPIVLYLSQIRDVELTLNRLIIHTHTASFKFIVFKGKQWQSSIIQSLNANKA